MNRIKTAVILAAGLGTRFGDMVEHIPKSFICVNNKPMIIRSIETLIMSGIDRIIIGTGFKKECFEQLKNSYPQIECCYNPIFATTNSMWTLHICKEVVGSNDFILLESDIIYEKRAIDEILGDKRENIILISDIVKFQDQYYVEYNSNLELTECSTDETTLNVCGEMVGIFKINSTLYTLVNKYFKSVKDESPKLGYESCLLHIAKTEIAIGALNIKNLKWYEIDNSDDLQYAEQNIRL